MLVNDTLDNINAHAHEIFKFTSDVDLKPVGAVSFYFLCFYFAKLAAMYD